MITHNNGNANKESVEPSFNKQPTSIEVDVDLNSSQKEIETESNKKTNIEKGVKESPKSIKEQGQNNPIEKQVVESSDDSEKEFKDHQSSITLYEMGVFPKKSLNDTFLKMVGSHHYSNYVSMMKKVEKEHYNDEDAGDAIVTIRGKSNPGIDEWESIIIYDIRGLQYAAYKKGKSIFYHSNDPEYHNKLPANIENWKETFDISNVEFLS
ncbi:hypothetical protein [Bacillus sp. J37]|uniref:hypothetical protein n=1 Tax=Bacillus sp. J37 TaxID=935837 RepID=UPI000478B228|nr:hypothetical protein [Bacillus sp. J37]